MDDTPFSERNNNFLLLFLKRLFVFACVLLVLGVIGYGIIAYMGARTQPETLPANSSPYSAVFLNNNQVYFGKIESVKDGYLTLSDVYYVAGTVGNQAGGGANADALQLIKLGNELHGPTDTMSFSGANVLYYEHLRTDSRIVQSIQKSKTLK